MTRALRVETWIGGECAEIAARDWGDALRLAALCERAEASGWAICDTTAVSERRPIATWSAGETYWDVFMRQATAGVLKIPGLIPAAVTAAYRPIWPYGGYP